MAASPLCDPVDPELEERIYEAERRNGHGTGLLGGLRTGDWLDAQQFPPLQSAVSETSR